ncbi:hypothetical protein [Pseudobdellovibrio exovorus]|uniref:Uncharacterized protein n=1 Tax=Pseudobdellovibrio exovorus JSS TaxID=1184267 RepID=M4V9F3_9BACT|nr:hypothetical protein [Pseudobdellovibrio exovorus]AGH95853.1 hypothetical protein A11Q_1637 [Pseudobdellovibrio exovorus JSS]
MKLTSYSFNIVLVVLALLCWAMELSLPEPNPIKRADYIAPPIELKYLSAGFAHQASDSFWLRAVQDFDHCNQPLNEQECKGRSWLFDVVNMVVELDKYFKEAYYYGALSLTVLISDYMGASIIFDKGVKVFPQEWPLLYAAGYHALYEEQDKSKAADLYLAAANNGAPEWVRSMAGRLASEGGDNIKAEEILRQLIDLEKDPRWIEKLQKKIEASKASSKAGKKTKKDGE